jgi:hypothetical protein
MFGMRIRCCHLEVVTQIAVRVISYTSQACDWINKSVLPCLIIWGQGLGWKGGEGVLWHMVLLLLLLPALQRATGAGPITTQTELNR